MDDILDSKEVNKDIFVYPDGSIYAPWGYVCLFEDDNDEK